MNSLKLVLLLFFVSVVETFSAQSIGIAKTVDMSFGNVAVIGAGTVILDPTGLRTGTGGVTLPSISGTVTSASFDISGTAFHTYSITLPLGGCTISSGGNTMTVDTFTSSPSATGTLNGGGTQQLEIGATLHINGAQPSGTYMSTVPFTVTVNYN